MKFKIPQKASRHSIFIALTCSLIVMDLGMASGQNYISSIEIPRIDKGDVVIEDTVARFIINYDAQTLGAKYVAYKLCKSDIEGEIQRKNRFFSDPRLIKRHIPCAKNSDYASSGYDRGHLLPSGDRQATQKANDATFSLANCLPQTPQLNRGTWKKLEESLRRQLSAYDTIYIVTGVIAPKPKATSAPKSTIKIGASGLQVPHSFFKAFIRVKDGNYDGQAYIMPNSTQIETTLSIYKKTIDQVELLSGLDLFVNLEDSIENRVEQM